MQNFDWTQFTKKIAVKTTLPVMYNAWAQSTEITKWFLSKADYFDKDLQPVDKEIPFQKGFHYEWSWLTYDVVEKGQITEANGKDFIQFTFAGSCLVDLNFTTHRDHIVLELIQKNIPTDDDSKKNIRLGCSSGWAFYMVNLKSVYEGGLDLRNKEMDFKSMVNS